MKMADAREYIMNVPAWIEYRVVANSPDEAAECLKAQVQSGLEGTTREHNWDLLRMIGV